MGLLEASSVAVAAGLDHYGRAPDAAESVWPERLIRSEAVDPVSAAYAGVRTALHLLGFDAGRFGTPAWSPLSGIIRPGATVVLKPNFVRHFRDTLSGHDDCLITHGAVIRAVAEFVYIALEGRGRIIIADAPQNDGDFSAICKIAQVGQIQATFRRDLGFEIEVLDLRQESAQKRDGVIVGHTKLPGDPEGYVAVDLGAASAFSEIERHAQRLYGAEYDMEAVRRHHQAGRHEYLISRTVLSADVCIGIPKLKTHKKTGITGCLKNLVGINGDKNWLPHHRIGDTSEGGDEFAADDAVRRIERIAVGSFKRIFPSLGPMRTVLAGPVKRLGRWVFGSTEKDTVRSGNWYGNDTTWRMVHDLNRILLYADATGRIHAEPVRPHLSIVDAIVCGEGNGPLDARPRGLGMILAGSNPLAVDVAACRLMGFDYRRLPLLANGFAPSDRPLGRFRPEQIRTASNDPRFDGFALEIAPADPPFEAHFGWRGHVELNQSRRAG